ncbi:calcium:proton antiporter [Micrococcus luteus]|uniref:calcium:proton antiporter n=1 Tax=Micrococcus luteus TaxID=1270 RepID=UPI002DDC9AFE|nr:calcium:proton antiporter [Micrococcus luteus]
MRAPTSTPSATTSAAPAAVRAVLSPAALGRLGLGWGAVVALAVLRPDPTSPGTGVVLALLAGIVAIIVACASGVVAQAEHLARRLGEPYGTLVLTLSIVVIEVVLISSVLLGPGDHATIARDSVMAVAMIILNLVAGAALLVGGRRHGVLRPNPAGLSAYLALLGVLLTAAFVLPGLIGDGGAYAPGQAVATGVLTLVLYGWFLHRQTGPQRRDFQEPRARVRAARADSATTAADRRGRRREIGLRSGVLVATVVPIMLLSHDMAGLLDLALGRVGAPAALSGILIAAVVFLPETLTALRAAAAGETQRVVNLCHGGWSPRWA